MFSHFYPDFEGFELEAKSNAQAIKFRKEGNEEYNKGNFLSAINSYNESLCDAETCTELALAYGNRSAVYFEIKLYSECLQNIELAMCHKFPKKKIAQLLERKNKCLKQLESFGNVDPSDEVKSFFTLSHPPNPKIPFVVDCVEIKRDDTYGRGIYATKDLNPGDILAIEPPIMTILYDCARYVHCCNCFKINNFNLIPCKFTSEFE